MNDLTAGESIGLLRSESVLSERDISLIEVDTDVKGEIGTIDLSAAVQQQMAGVRWQGQTDLVRIGPSAGDLSLGSLTTISYTGRLLHDAKENIAAGDYAVAARLLDDLIGMAAAEAEHDEARFLRALCYTHLDDPEGALRALLPLRGKELSPELRAKVADLRGSIRGLMTPLVVMAFMASFPTDPADAETAIRRVIELDPEAGLYYYVLAGALASRGDPEQALQVLEQGLQTATDDQEGLRSLDAHIRGQLVGRVLERAVGLFKSGSYRQALQQVKALPDAWRNVQVVQDFAAYLRQLNRPGGTASRIPPKGPFDRVDALYFLVARDELAEGKDLLSRNQLSEAERALARIFGFAPRFPYANFLHAATIYRSVGNWLGDPEDVDFDHQIQRLDTASQAARIAATDAEIEQASKLVAAIDALRAFLTQLRDLLHAHQQEAGVINPAITEFQAIMESARGGIDSPEQLDELGERLKRLKEGMPELRAAAISDPAKKAVAQLGQAIDGMLAQLERAAGPRKLMDRYQKIMASLSGGTPTQQQLQDATRLFLSLRDDIPAATRAAAGSKDARKALERLDKAVKERLKELDQARQSLGVGTLTQQLNGVIEQLNTRGAQLTPDEARTLLLIVDNILGEADRVRATVTDREARKRVDQIKQAASQLHTVLAQVTRRW